MDKNNSKTKTLAVALPALSLLTQLSGYADELSKPVETSLPEEASVSKGTLKAQFDVGNYNKGVEPTQDLAAKINNIYSKKAVREALEDAYPITIQHYGRDGQTLKEKYFDDIQDKVVKVSSSLPAGTGTQDSTNITGTDFGYDNCNLNPTKTGVNYASPGQGCICHGACHGQCFLPLNSSSLKVLNKNIRVDSSWGDNHDMVLEDGDEYALQGLFNVSQSDQQAQDCILV